MFVMCPSAGRSAECGSTEEQGACNPEHRVRSTKKKRQADIVLGGHADRRRRELRRLM